MDRAIRVACATDSGTLIDGHFGSCKAFVIYAVRPGAIEFIDARSTLTADQEEDKNKARASLIGDCQIACFASIGGPAAAKVVRAWYTHRGRKRKLDQCPDAIVAADDCMALAVMDTLRHELQMNVPDEVSVVGFDDVPQAAWPAYQLSTYAQPLSDMIDAVWQLLRLQIQSQDGPAEPNTQSLGRAVVLPGQLRWRASARGAQG